MKPKSYPCLKCGKTVLEMYPNRKKTSDEKKMWQYGIVFQMTAGYGSAHDGYVFNAALCDECIDSGVDEGNIKFIMDYIHGGKYIPLKGDNK